MGGKLKEFNCDLSLVRSNVGDVETDDLNTLLGAVFSLATSAVNKKLESGFDFPSHFGKVSLSNSSIFYYQGNPDFYAIGTNVVYNGMINNAGDDLSNSFKLMITQMFEEYHKVLKKILSR